MGGGASNNIHCRRFALWRPVRAILYLVCPGWWESTWGRISDFGDLRSWILALTFLWSGVLDLMLETGDLRSDSGDVYPMIDASKRLWAEGPAGFFVSWKPRTVAVKLAEWSEHMID